MSFQRLAAVCRLALFVCLSNAVAHATVLTHVAGAPYGVSSPTGVALSPDHTFLYVLSNSGSGTVAVFAVNPLTGQLTTVPAAIQQGSCSNSTFNSILKVPSSIAITGDGNFAYTTARGANGSLGTVGVFSRDNTGVLTCKSSVSSKSLKGAAGISVSTDVSPANGSVYLTVGSGKNQGVVLFTRNGTTGLLSGQTSYLDGRNGANFLGGASDTVVGPDDKDVYVTAANDDALTTFGRSTSSGTLFTPPAGVLRDNVAGVDALLGANSLVLSPDGHQVYTTAPLDNAIGVFSRDTGTGALTFASMAQNGGLIAGSLIGVTGVAVTPDGGYAFGAAPTNGALTLFSRDGNSGALAFIESASVSGARNVLATGIANNGECAYVTGTAGVDAYCVTGALDLGDAPDVYRTLVASDGPRHVVPLTPTLTLGSNVDTETDGQPTANATGDDTNPALAPNDEDGVTLPAQPIVVDGNPRNVTVNAPNGGTLDAWIDLDGSGTFDADEQIATGVLLASGSTQIPFTPAPGETYNGATIARFRLHENGTGKLSPSGGGGVGEVEDYQITFNAVTAKVTLTKDPTGNGTGRVVSSPAKLDCGASCTSQSKIFAQSADVVLTATASTGSSFAGWSGDCSADPCEFNPLGATDKNVTAKFTLNSYNLTVDVDSGGAVSGDVTCSAGSQCVQGFLYGTQIALHADPDTGNNYVFTGWTGACAGIGDCVLTMGAADTEVHATFALSALDLHLDATTGSGSGTITVQPADVNNNSVCTGVCDLFYTAGTVLTITGTADADSALTVWTLDGNTNSPSCNVGTGTCGFTINTNRTLTADFDFSPIAVTVVDESPTQNGGNYPNDGNPVQIRVTVANVSTVVAPSGSVSIVSTHLPANATFSTWTCVNHVGTTCGNGTGNINDNVSLPIGASVQYLIAGTAGTPAINGFTTTVTANDPDLGGAHSADDVGSAFIKYLKVALDGFDGGDLNAWNGGHTP